MEGAGVAFEQGPLIKKKGFVTTVKSVEEKCWAKHGKPDWAKQLKTPHLLLTNKIVTLLEILLLQL